ncbi:MAG: SDR family oxidoreductase [Pseudomonadota bacterium]
MEHPQKVAVVTGGAMGIGRAIAERLVREGSAVVIADRQGAEAAANEIKAAGGQALGVACDVTDKAACEAMAAAAQARFGRITTLVNNAGIYSSLQLTAFEEITVEDWRRVLEVNVMGQALVTAALLPQLCDGGGAIVNISSGTPYKGVPFLLHYVASKGAINAMTRALAKELGAQGIRVNGVAPGFTLSDGVKNNPEQLTKLREISQKARVIQRDQEVEDIVGAVAFLASADAAFITGQTLVVDGGAYFL